MVSATVEQYVDRTVDLLMFDGISAAGEAQLVCRLVQDGESGALIAGIQKLAQRFVLELCTEKGSMKYLPERGCDFMLDAKIGGWRTPAEVESSFNGAMIDIERNLMEEEADSDPLDERFASATLDAVSLASDRVVLHITVLSRAGASRTVLYPLRVSKA